MKNKNLIAINGHPGSGKDELGKMLKKYLPGKTIIVKMAEPIGYALKAGLSLDDKNYEYYREKGKEAPLFGFPGMPNFRTCMINYSEVFLKKTFNEDIFAILMMKRLRDIEEEYDNIIITDTGFNSEFNYLASKLLNSNFKIFLYRINRPQNIPKISLFVKIKRFIMNDKTFIGDSREPVYPEEYNKGHVTEIDYENSGDLSYLDKFAIDQVRHIGE